VLEKYGVPASRYADFAMLRGDPSDGLPGVRGVGEKTARSLVLTYPNLEALVEDAKWAKTKDTPLQRSASLRAAVREAGDYLKAMQDVVPIRTDLEVRAWQGEPDEARLEELSASYRLAGPIRRLREALAGEGPAAPRRSGEPPAAGERSTRRR
jgi:5'-3' exonuclease